MLSYVYKIVVTVDTRVQAAQYTKILKITNLTSEEVKMKSLQEKRHVWRGIMRSV